MRKNKMEMKIIFFGFIAQDVNNFEKKMYLVI